MNFGLHENTSSSHDSSKLNHCNHFYRPPYVRLPCSVTVKRCQANDYFKVEVFPAYDMELWLPRDKRQGLDNQSISVSFRRFVPNIKFDKLCVVLKSSVLDVTWVDPWWRHMTNQQPLIKRSRLCVACVKNTFVPWIQLFTLVYLTVLFGPQRVCVVE